MQTPWTVDRVTALAPDASSASAGLGLASPKKWVSLGRSERALWGLCQGSGKDPYQSRIDLSEPAFKCSCPSRKFPCKHGLGLFLLFVKDAAAFRAEAEPGWVSDWIAGRAERAEKQVEKAKAAAEKPVDVEAQARRAAKREQRVRDGVAECRVWVEDLVRRGLAAAQSEGGEFWERAAARMVDAQAAGLAAMVRRVAGAVSSGEGWQTRAVDWLGRLHLLLAAAERLEQLPPDLAGDVRTALGWTQSKDEALAGEGVKDRWSVVGQVVEEEDRLRARRTWLVGCETRRRALVLEFAAGTAPFDVSLSAGTEFEGELAFFASRLPLRAVVKSRAEAGAGDGSHGLSGQSPGQPVARVCADETVEEALRGYAGALAANPWVLRWPVVLAGARVARAGERWLVVDRAGAGLPLRPGFGAGLDVWRLISASGGGEATICGEWDGEFLLPLSAIGGGGAGGFVDVAPRWAA